MLFRFYANFIRTIEVKYVTISNPQFHVSGKRSIEYVIVRLSQCPKINPDMGNAGKMGNLVADQIITQKNNPFF